ncbi:MAG: recombination mediator RecR [Leptonema sp. (in: bacteria)]
MFLKELQNFIEIFSQLPGIGEKSARRIAFYLLKISKEEAKKFSDALIELYSNIRFCSVCGGFSTTSVCEICSSSERNRTILCVVEYPSDIFVIESTKEYNGLYHVLMGALSPIDGIGPEDLRIKELEDRLKKESIKECFIATNPTLEGDATADYISRKFSAFPVVFTRLMHGITTGSSIEFSDKYSLALSIRNRIPIKV